MKTKRREAALLRGRSLLSCRLKLRRDASRICAKLRLSQASYAFAEEHDLVFPASTQAKLSAMRLGAKPSPRTADLPLGTALREWRQENKITAKHVQELCRVEPDVLEFVERHKWPVLPEWLPRLREMGFGLVFDEFSKRPSLRREEALRRLRAGQCLQGAAAAVNATRESVAKWGRAAGIPVPTPTHPGWKYEPRDLGSPTAPEVPPEGPAPLGKAETPASAAAEAAPVATPTHPGQPASAAAGAATHFLDLASAVASPSVPEPSPDDRLYNQAMSGIHDPGGVYVFASTLGFLRPNTPVREAYNDVQCPFCLQLRLSIYYARRGTLMATCRGTCGASNPAQLKTYGAGEVARRVLQQKLHLGHAPPVDCRGIQEHRQRLAQMNPSVVGDSEGGVFLTPPPRTQPQASVPPTADRVQAPALREPDPPRGSMLYDIRRARRMSPEDLASFMGVAVQDLIFVEKTNTLLLPTWILSVGALQARKEVPLRVSLPEGELEELCNHAGALPQDSGASVLQKVAKVFIEDQRKAPGLGITLRISRPYGLSPGKKPLVP